MPGIKEIKDRINSIKDTQKITNAMYLISSTKLRKARADLEKLEPYFYGMQAMMERLQRHVPDGKNPYFEHSDVPPEDRVYAFLVVTADKGLAGSYNHNVLKTTEKEMAKHKNTKLFVVGEVGRHYFEHRHIPIDEEFHYTAQNPTLHRSRLITLKMLDMFLAGEIDELYIVYTIMISKVETFTMQQQLLPLKSSAPLLDLPLDVVQEEFMLEPSAEAVLEAVVPNCTNGYIYSALVESFCSEQNSRMMAMQTANDAANSLIHDLSIRYNRVRQAMITQEITEVCSGARAQKRS